MCENNYYYRLWVGRVDQFFFSVKVSFDDINFRGVLFKFRAYVVVIRLSRPPGIFLGESFYLNKSVWKKVPSMIRSAIPTVTSEVNIVFT